MNFYLIAKGECTVRVGEEHVDIKEEKKLRFGDYFGEISLIYGCKTTAKIIARKYCNLAILNKSKFEEVLLQFPGLKETFKKDIYKYNDKLLRFIKRGLKRVTYFRSLPEDQLFDIVFALKVKAYIKGEILQKPGEDASSLFFLQKGIIEVSTKFEGLDFVIERLFRGSCLNYRTFFMEEGAAV